MLEETKCIAESAKDQRNNNFGSDQNINVESGPRRVLEAKRLGGKKKEWKKIKDFSSFISLEY